jgi:hypothetical protein
MYLMYVDESGDPGLVRSPTNYFALSGIVVHERRWRQFVTSLVSFKKKMRAVYGLPVRAEIHASEFINRRVYNLDRHVRLAILRNSLDELAKTPDISITNVIVNKVGKPQGYDVFGAAWRTLFQRFENTLVYSNYPGGFRDDFGIVFTDATAGKTLQNIVRKMSVYNPVPNDPSFGPGYRNLQITRIIEDPHGKNSADSLAVQMADVCAYFLHQRYRPNNYIKQKSAELYFDRLTPVLNTRASRRNAFGVVEI